MNRLWPWLVAALAVTAALGTCQRADRDRGAMQIQLDASERREQRHQRRVDSLERVRIPQAAAAVKWLTAYDTARVAALAWALDSARRSPAFRSETIPVPVAVLITADSAISTCTRARNTCEQALAAASAVTAEVREQLRLKQLLGGRPWTAAGLAYDPLEARWGAFVDRDWARLRVGASVTPSAQGLRAGVRVGWRW